MNSELSTVQTKSETTPETMPSPSNAASSKPSGSGHPTSLEFTKVVLEFLSKGFYPAILITVLYILWPALSRIDMIGLFGRLQSAKVGDYELTFGQAQTVGAEIAPLNSKVAELERNLNSAVSELRKLQEVSTLPKLSSQEVKAQEAKEQKLKANSDYTVLVFHRGTSRERAATVTKALLAHGFQSSDTETDFAELQKVKPEDNVIFLTYTTKGEEILPDLEKELATLAPGAVVRRNPRPINMRRGDVQMLIF